MKIKKISYLVLLVIIISSCSTPIDNSEFNKEGYNVSRFVPSSNDKYLDSTESEVNRYARNLNIYPITDGFDSIQYRLWIQDFDYCPKSFDAQKLLIIKKYRADSWKATLINFGIGDMEKDHNKIVCKDIINIEPKNWDSLISNMNKLNINNWVGSTFFSDDQYHGGGYVNFIVLEIATTHQYRLITHFSPRKVICEEQECKELRAFLVLLAEAFNLPVYKYYSGN